VCCNLPEEEICMLQPPGKGCIIIKEYIIIIGGDIMSDFKIGKGLIIKLATAVVAVTMVATGAAWAGEAVN